MFICCVCFLILSEPVLVLYLNWKWISPNWETRTFWSFCFSFMICHVKIFANMISIIQELSEICSNLLIVCEQQKCFNRFSVEFKKWIWNSIKIMNTSWHVCFVTDTCTACSPYRSRWISSPLHTGEGLWLDKSYMIRKHCLVMSLCKLSVF